MHIEDVHFYSIESVQQTCSPPEICLFYLYLGRWSRREKSMHIEDVHFYSIESSVQQTCSLMSSEFYSFECESLFSFETAQSAPKY
jgi:hypothetical protein